MNFDKIVDFFNYNHTCVVCSKPMALLIKDYKIDKDGSFNYNFINDNCVNIQVTQSIFRNLQINIENNSYCIPNSNKDYMALSSILNSKKIIFSRKCNCSSNFYIICNPLVFGADGYIRPFSLEFLSFRIDKNDESSIIVTNNYKSHFTSILDIRVDPPYFTYKKTKYTQLPLVNFESYNKDKILRKINTLITFS